MKPRRLRGVTRSPRVPTLPPPTVRSLLTSLLLTSGCALLLTSACAGPPPEPLSGAAVEAALAPPGLEAVRVRAPLVEHPLLPSVAFDERDGLSADEAAILAVLANPTLRAVRDRRGIAAAELLRAGILPNPELSASVGWPVGSGTDETVTGFDLGLDWNLSALVARGARLDAAREHARAVDLDVAWQEWQVAEGAKLHLQRLALAERRRETGRRAVRSARQTLRATRRAVELGVGTGPAVDAARASLETARSRLAGVDAARQVERIALDRALGLPADRPLAGGVEAGPGFEPSPEPGGARLHALRTWPLPPVAELLDGLSERRLDLAALRAGYASQDATLRAAVRSRFPKIGVGLAAGRDPEGIETAGGGVTIELPLFDRNQGEIAVARATRQELFDEYAARLADARAEVVRIVAEIEGARRRLDLADRGESARARRLRRARRAADEGSGDRFAVGRAESDLLAARQARLDLEQRLGDLAVALEIATGRVLFSRPAMARETP
jgi:outer membrane protein TolC